MLSVVNLKMSLNCSSTSNKDHILFLVQYSSLANDKMYESNLWNRTLLTEN